MRLTRLRFVLFAGVLALPQVTMAQTPAPPSPMALEAEADQRALESALLALRTGQYREALSQAENLASRGNPKAAALAGSIYEQNLIDTATPEAAVRWYRRAVTGGNSDAMLGLARLGMARKGGSTPGEALSMLQRAAANGRKEALAPLGDLFLSGAAGPKDRTRAASIYAQAASYGDADAAYAAGILYADGDPDPMDDPLKAIGYLRQAAQAGRADAAADYGLMLYQGRGVARDLKGAAQWFKTAAEGGDMDGAFYWALVNAKGEGTPQNLELAVQWARVAKGSSPDADRLLAQLEAIAAKPKPAASKP
ncbi:tetratricopeptide repeat protein [Aquidulcibacter sp.]|uniref:tetratricopeptide repeat protein n=1 Tax=Aquidulcibacter sp. TaxID=2052990 RepID=UPI003BA6A098